MTLAKPILVLNISYSSIKSDESEHAREFDLSKGELRNRQPHYINYTEKDWMRLKVQHYTLRM